MLRTAVFVFIACCALSEALSLAEDTNKSKPSATVSPASLFGSSSEAPSPTTMAPNTTTMAPNITTMAPNTTTMAPNITTMAPNITTMAPNITTMAPNTTTMAPNTTTLAPNTTTLAPNTTTLAPNTTTMAPSTTTLAPPTPTPTPSTDSTIGYYNITNSKNETCLKAQMVLQIRGVTTKTQATFIVQPKETHAKGSCNEDTVSLQLVFKQGFITFNFTKSVPNNTVYVDAVSFNLNYPLIQGGTSYNAANKSVHLFPAQIGHSYSCMAESIYMGNNLYLDVNSDKMQAFNLTKNDFGYPDHCPADQHAYQVAIGVGVALLVLIVVVVVAYLLSRKKRTDGYQSL